jgi:hypothetical protein
MPAFQQVRLQGRVCKSNYLGSTRLPRHIFKPGSSDQRVDPQIGRAGSVEHGRRLVDAANTNFKRMFNFFRIKNGNFALTLLL